jgi:hypothetical protein
VLHGLGAALALAAVSLLAPGLAGGGVNAHRVPAGLTDAAIGGDRPGQPNRVWAPDADARRGVLLLRFPGSDGSTAASDLMAEQMANDGFHVISLAYDPGRVTIRATCTYARVRRDPDCALKFRGERFYGGGYDSPFIAVDRAHSVMNRLIKLLSHLVRAYPGEGWGRFVSRTPSAVYGGYKPRFDRIMVSGHSQGAGMALFTARERRVLAVAMFGGANDYAIAPGGDVAVADWVRGRLATPRGRIFGFGHTKENGHAGQLAVWAALGLAGAPASVDSGAPPFGGSHRLVSSRAPRGCARPAACDQAHFHGSTIVDAFTPRAAGGAPAYGPVWRHMLAPPR